RTLGVEIPEGNAKALIEDLAECRNSRTGVERFLVVADGLLDCFFPGGEGVERERGLLQGFRHWSGDWEEGILKLRDTEYHLLVCLPLGAMLRRVESACLALPEREALRISHIYRSPLLSPRFMSQVLHLVASGKAPGDASAMDSQGMNGWVRDEEKDCLWKLYTGQLDDVDYPFERVLPQPWMYPLPDLMRRLHAVLRRRFTSYLASNRSQAVDYALEVFRRVGDESLVPALLEHFESLITRHYHSFIELMTHLPHQDFLPPLLSYYREGETDLRQLIRFICDVHSRVYPAAVKVATEDETPVPALSTLRLRCPACGGAYQYRPKQLFVNEDRIEQRQIPTPNDLWSPEPLHCKQCQALVPLAPDERYLADLFSELLARRMMRSEPPAAMNPDLLMLVSFPKVHGVSRHPEVFMESLKAAQGKGAEHIRLMLELGRFRMDTGQREEARGLFTRLLSGPVPCPQALFYLGLIAFQERNLYQARIYFSRLVQTSAPEDFQDELDNPVDMAHHYLKLLDKREFKRSQFQIVDN
ncbi:MAG: hypothetical protein OEW39_01075, partial [Deltaproteobacteria bacterium]|nr:hypothetical protein [Deltaproteobacteria bacterium]